MVQALKDKPSINTLKNILSLKLLDKLPVHPTIYHELQFSYPEEITSIGQVNSFDLYGAIGAHISK